MGWLDALVGAVGNAARSTANNTVKAASQPSQRQSSPRQQQSTAPSSNFWQSVNSAISDAARVPIRQINAPSNEGQGNAQGSRNNEDNETQNMSYKERKAKEKEDKRIYKETKKAHDLFKDTRDAGGSRGRAMQTALREHPEATGGISDYDVDYAYSPLDEELLSDQMRDKKSEGRLTPYGFEGTARDIVNNRIYSPKQAQMLLDMAEDDARHRDAAGSLPLEDRSAFQHGIIPGIKQGWRDSEGKPGWEGTAPAAQNPIEQLGDAMIPRAFRTEPYSYEDKDQKPGVLEALYNIIGPEKAYADTGDQQPQATTENKPGDNLADEESRIRKGPKQEYDPWMPNPNTTNPQEAAMPSGEQLSQMTPEERNDWEARTLFGLGLSGAIASLPVTAGTGALPAALVGSGLFALDNNMNNAETARIESTKKNEEVTRKAQEAGITPEELIYGKTPEEISQMYEDAIYDLAMQDEAYRKAFNEAGYGDQFGSYAAYGSLGDTNDYESRRNITRDIFGLNEGENPLEIQGLKDIYKEKGTINDNMTNEEMLNAILNDHWGAGRLVDPYQWMFDESYQQAHPFNGTSAADAYSQYWLDSGVIPPLQEGAENLFSGFGNDWDKLNNADIAAMMNAGNVINQANAGMQFSDSDLETLSKIFGEGYMGREGGGDRASFAWLPDGSSEKDGYVGREWHGNNKTYSAKNVLNAVNDASQGNYGVYLNPYLQYDLALGDQDLTDAVMEAIQKNDKQGRSIGRKD